MNTQDGDAHVPNRELVPMQEPCTIPAEEVARVITAMLHCALSQSSLRYLVYHVFGYGPKEYETIRKAAEPFEGFIRLYWAALEGVLLLKHYYETLPDGPERVRAAAVLAEFFGDLDQPQPGGPAEPERGGGDSEVEGSEGSPSEPDETAGLRWYGPMDKKAVMQQTGMSESAVDRYLHGKVKELQQSYRTLSDGSATGYLKDKRGNRVKFKVWRKTGPRGPKPEVMLLLPEHDFSH